MKLFRLSIMAFFLSSSDKEWWELCLTASSKFEVYCDEPEPEIIKLPKRSSKSDFVKPAPVAFPKEDKENVQIKIYCDENTNEVKKNVQIINCNPEVVSNRKPPSRTRPAKDCFVARKTFFKIPFSFYRKTNYLSR